jgi:hypothetical protein
VASTGKGPQDPPLPPLPACAERLRAAAAPLLLLLPEPLPWLLLLLVLRLAAAAAELLALLLLEARLLLLLPGRAWLIAFSAGLSQPYSGATSCVCACRLCTHEIGHCKGHGHEQEAGKDKARRMAVSVVSRTQGLLLQTGRSCTPACVM